MRLRSNGSIVGVAWPHEGTAAEGGGWKRRADGQHAARVREVHPGVNLPSSNRSVQAVPHSRTLQEPGCYRAISRACDPEVQRR